MHVTSRNLYARNAIALRLFCQGRSQDLREEVAGRWIVQITSVHAQSALAVQNVHYPRHIFFTCSEIDSNAIWLKK